MPTSADIAAVSAKIMGVAPPPPEAPETPEVPETTEAQSVESEQPEVEATDQTPLEGGESEGQQTGSEVEEIEFDGVKFSLPKEHIQKVKDALMRHSDYTQKTQETSERARVLSEQEKMFRAQMEFHKNSVDDIATIRAYEQAIGQYANVNWLGMPSEEAMRTKIQYDQLKDGLQRAKEQLNQKWSQFNQQRNQSMTELSRAARSEITKRIPGFSESSEKELKDYARTRGYQDAAVEQLMLNPLDTEMIWKAQQYDRIQASKGQINQRANKAPPIVKPTGAQKQVSEAAKLLASMRSAKDRPTREKFGTQILAKKLGI